MIVLLFEQGSVRHNKGGPTEAQRLLDRQTSADVSHTHVPTGVLLTHPIPRPIRNAASSLHQNLSNLMRKTHIFAQR